MGPERLSPRICHLPGGVAVTGKRTHSTEATEITWGQITNPESGEQ